MHKKFLSILIGLFLVGSIALAQQTFKITYAEGEIYSQGNKLTTEKGRVEIRLGEANFLRLDKNTIITFNPLKLWKGSIYIRVNAGIIEIQTIYDKNFILGNGLYRLDVKNNRIEYFKGDRPIDRFASWNNGRERQEFVNFLGRYGSWRRHSIYGWTWIPLHSYWRLRYSYRNWLGHWAFRHYGRWQGRHWIPGKHIRTIIHKNRLKK